MHEIHENLNPTEITNHTVVIMYLVTAMYIVNNSCGYSSNDKLL